MVLEKTLESPLESKEIKPANLKGSQPWILFARTDAEAETPILWAPDAMSWLTGKDLDARKDWRWEEKGTTEDEMVGWHHQFNGHEFGQTPGDSEGQESLVCCSPWYREKSDMTWSLNNKVSLEAERWIHSCQSNFLQIEKQAIRKYCNHKHNHLACHFLSLSLPVPQGAKRTEKKRETKASTAMHRKTQGLELELIRF